MVLKEFRYLLVAKEFRLPHRLHTVQNLPERQEGERDADQGESTLTRPVVTLLGRPCLFVVFDSFLALKRDQVGNPLPDGARRALPRPCSTLAGSRYSWLTADHRVLGPLMLSHQVFLGQTKMKPSGSW